MSQLKVNSIVPVGGLPSGANGGILQVVQAVKTDTFSFTGTSFTDITGLSASITPSSSSNKVLIVAQIYMSADSSRDTAKINFVRGSTNIAQPSGSVAQTSTMMNYLSAITMFPMSMNFLDSPATTSATTYKLQIGKDGTNNKICLNRYSEADNYHGISTLTLYEVTA